MPGRVAVTTVLALAIAAAPVVLDRCAASCRARQETAASTPSCHHHVNVEAGPRASRVPAPCGHDHHVTMATVENGSNRPTQPAASGVLLAAHTSHPSATLAFDVRAHAPPGMAPRPAPRSSVLRI